MLAAVRRAAETVHFVVAAAVGGLSFVLVSFLGLLVVLVPGGARRAAVLLARTFHFVMRAVLGWRMEVTGREGLTAHAPCVIMVTHQSNLDIVVFGGVYPARAVVVGKKEVGKIPVFGWFFRASGNILLDRKNLERAIASIREAAERVRRDRLSVWVFPEGHRNPGAVLLPFKKGAFHLAIAAQVPIVPVACSPVTAVLDAHRWRVRPGSLRIKVLPPVPSAGLTPDRVDELMERVRSAMQAAKDELRYSAPG